MFVQFVERMTPRDNVKATVRTIRRLYRGPRCDHLVGWPEREIIKVLMRWMSRKIVGVSIGDMCDTTNHIQRRYKRRSIRDSYELEPDPRSGGFAINMLCMAIMLGPVKHSTISNSLSCWRYS